MANCANITRRSIFKLAPAAVLAAGGAVAIFPTQSTAKTPAPTLEQEIEACLSKLRGLVLKKYPKTNFLKHEFENMRDGGFVFTLEGRTPKAKVVWSGAGYYEVFVRTDDIEPSLMWIEECWDHLRDCTGYRGCGREAGQRTSAYVYFPKHSLRIHKKV